MHFTRSKGLADQPPAPRTRAKAGTSVTQHATPPGGRRTPSSQHFTRGGTSTPHSTPPPSVNVTPTLSLLPPPQPSPTAVSSAASNDLPPENEAILSLLSLSSDPSSILHTEHTVEQSPPTPASVPIKPTIPLATIDQRSSETTQRKGQAPIAGTNGQGVQMVFRIDGSCESQSTPKKNCKSTRASSPARRRPTRCLAPATPLLPRTEDDYVLSDAIVEISEEDADEVFLLPPTHRLKHEMSCDDLYMYMAWDSIAAADEVQMSVDISHPMPAHDEARQQELLALRKAALTTMLNIVDGTKTTYRSYLFIFKSFCDSKYPHEGPKRYEVYDDKVIGFFNQCMFRRTKIKHFHPKKFYINEPLFLNEREVPQDTPLLSEQTASIGRSKKKRRTVPTVDLAALLRDVIDDKDGRKALEVPCGKTTMEQALKAIIKLHDLQRQRLTNPSDIKFQATDYLRSMIDQYHQGLVTGSYLDSSGALLNSIFALAYDTKQHIQLLLDAWENIEETTLSLTMRNHFGLAIRHSMMLRDEDLRNALLGNALMPIIPNKAGGTQVVHALTFTMNQDKMNKDGKVQYGVALRHIDVRRCSVGALAFYLFERWINPSDLPNFTSPDFHRLVLLHSGPDPLQPILHQVSHDMVKKAYLRQGINLNNIAHAGRHSGALEAQKMGLSAHHIQIAGRSPTVSGRMDQGYPVDAAFALAGFMNHPFHLRRCEVHPSNELQMTIFSFVESALFSEGSVERREWVRKCRDAMEEKLSETKQPYHTVHIEPLRDMVAATRDEDSTNQFTRQQLFLLMLVRMRRIILQDAAEYLCRFEGMNQPVLLKPVFRSPAFKAFQEEVRLCLSQPEPVEIHQWPPEAIQAFKHNEEIFYSLNNEVQQCRAELSSFLQEHRDFKRELGQWQQAMEQKLDQRLRQDRLAMQQIMEHWFKQNQRDTERIYSAMSTNLTAIKRSLQVMMNESLDPLRQEHAANEMPLVAPETTSPWPPPQCPGDPRQPTITSIRQSILDTLSLLDQPLSLQPLQLPEPMPPGPSGSISAVEVPLHPPRSSSTADNSASSLSHPQQPQPPQSSQNIHGNSQIKVPLKQRIRRITAGRVTVEDVWKDHHILIAEYGNEAKREKTLRNRAVIVREIRRMVGDNTIGLRDSDTDVVKDAIGQLQRIIDSDDVRSVNELVDYLRRRSKLEQ